MESLTFELCTLRWLLSCSCSWEKPSSLLLATWRRGLRCSQGGLGTERSGPIPARALIGLLHLRPIPSRTVRRSSFALHPPCLHPGFRANPGWAMCSLSCTSTASLLPLCLSGELSAKIPRSRLSPPPRSCPRWLHTGSSASAPGFHSPESKPQPRAFSWCTHSIAGQSPSTPASPHQCVPRNTCSDRAYGMNALMDE